MVPVLGLAEGTDLQAEAPGVNSLLPVPRQFFSGHSGCTYQSFPVPLCRLHAAHRIWHYSSQTYRKTSSGDTALKPVECPSTHLQSFGCCLALPHSLVSFLPPAPPQCLVKVLSLSDLSNTTIALGALTSRELSKVSLGTLSVQDTDIWKLGGYGKGFRAVLNKG